MIIVGLDPGLTTGGCVVNDQEFELGAQLYGHNNVWRFLSLYKPDVIVYEKWDNRQKAANKVAAPEIIGVIKLYAEQKGVLLVPQMPSQAKVLFSNDKLQKMGLYSRGRVHANDAARHLLYYLTTTQQIALSLLERLK